MFRGARTNGRLCREASFGAWRKGKKLGGVDGVEGWAVGPSAFCGDGLQAEAVFAGRNEGEGKGIAAGRAVEVFRFEPEAETRVANLTAAKPEFRTEPTLNLEVVELQFDDCRVPSEVAHCVDRADFDAGKDVALVLRFDDHVALTLASKLGDVKARIETRAGANPSWKKKWR